MKKYGIKYHPKVKEDIKSLDRQTKEKIKKAIEEKLTAEPLIYGERLKGTKLLHNMSHLLSSL